MKSNNKFSLTVTSNSYNESFVRVAVSSFVAQLDPTIDELCDIKTAVSEAVTNSIVHAYPDRLKRERSFIYISARLYDTGEVTVEVSDNGCGIENVERARMPMFTTGDSSLRSGMGFLVMESFTDSLIVKSKVGRGTTVLMRKNLKP